MTASSALIKKLIGALDAAAEGELTRPLRVSSKRLRRIGVWEGRKVASSFATLASLLSAVAATKASLIEEFIEQSTNIESRLTRAAYRLEDEQLKGRDFKESEFLEEKPSFFEGTPVKLNIKLGARQRSKFKTLDNAAEFLHAFRIDEAKRMKIKFQIDTINARQQALEMESEMHKRHLEKVLELKEALATVEEEKSQIPRRYAQKFLRMTSVAEACWAQYCAGYELGKSRIRPRWRLNKTAREKEREAADAKRAMPNPDLRLEFDRPLIFSFE